MVITAELSNGIAFGYYRKDVKDTSWYGQLAHHYLLVLMRQSKFSRTYLLMRQFELANLGFE